MEQAVENLLRYFGILHSEQMQRDKKVDVVVANIEPSMNLSSVGCLHYLVILLLTGFRIVSPHCTRDGQIDISVFLCLEQRMCSNFIQVLGKQSNSSCSANAVEVDLQPSCTIPEYQQINFRNLSSLKDESKRRYQTCPRCCVSIMMTASLTRLTQ